MIINHLIHILLCKIYDESSNTESTPHDHDLLSLRKEIFNKPHLTWTVENMANQLHLSSGYLQSIYKKKFGISCMDDVIDCRIKKAKDQLRYTNATILEIAEYVGYNNVEHFCRQFRKLTNQTPSTYRKTHK